MGYSKVGLCCRLQILVMTFLKFVSGSQKNFRSGTEVGGNGY